ncbi:MAG: hypothetical protein IJ551_04790 [Prevotella sp.]|nr:hypothetical protein [Prevotella sp.]
MVKASIEIRERRKVLKKEARFLLSLILQHPRFPFDVHISNAGIKEWLNQPHVHYAEKNEALLILPVLFAESEYVGPMLDSKNRPDVRYSQIFKVEIAGEDSWIIVHEMIWGEYLVHSVSDSLSPYYNK